MAAATQIEVNLPAYQRRFTPEFELVLACCDHARQYDLTSMLTPDLDWERVLDSAEHHRLIPAMHGALSGNNGVPSTLRARAHKHAWRVLHFTAELQKIARCFEQRGIEFLAHKGPALAQVLYGDPAMRQFGDLDVIVKSRDFRRAKDVLIESGYDSNLRLSPRHEQALLRSGYECSFGLNSARNLVELQWQIVPRFYSINFDIDALFSRSMQVNLDDVALRTLGREDLLMVLCVHAAKHEWVQLGMLRDIAALMNFDLDWNWIVAEARRLGIIKILQVSLLAANKLFNVSCRKELPSANEGTAELASAVVSRLQHNYEPDTESIRYFRAQLQTRERWLDRARFVWRLATTPSVQEWESIQIPDRCFAAYRGVRIARLMKRF
ncbi:MAG TPA: nucleotidyltransferase family protein, partial [Terriglobales bacterium]|nr:nucleotidyltransferase family protein [Terriglobales bacterium]